MKSNALITIAAMAAMTATAVAGNDSWQSFRRQRRVRRLFRSGRQDVPRSHPTGHHRPKGPDVCSARRGDSARGHGRIPQQRQRCAQRVLAFDQRQQKLGHNLGTWPQGQRQSFKFDNPGVSRSSATCIRTCLVISSCLRRHTLPRPTRPALTRSKRAGRSYTVTAWNEGAKSKSNPVNVAGDTTADFTLSK